MNEPRVEIEVGNIRGQVVALRSFVLVGISALVASAGVAGSVWLISGPVRGAGIVLLILASPFLLALAVSFSRQIILRRGAALLVVRSDGGRLTIRAPLAWNGSHAVRVPREGGVTLVLEPSTRLELFGFATRRGLSVPPPDHVRLNLLTSRESIVLSLFARPDQAWIEALLADLATAGVAVTYDA